MQNCLFVAENTEFIVLFKESLGKFTAQGTMAFTFEEANLLPAHGLHFDDILSCRFFMSICWRSLLYIVIHSKEFLVLGTAICIFKGLFSFDVTVLSRQAPRGS